MSRGDPEISSVDFGQTRAGCPAAFHRIPPGFQATRQTTHAARDVAYRAAHRPRSGPSLCIRGEYLQRRSEYELSQVRRDVGSAVLARCSRESCEEWRL